MKNMWDFPDGPVVKTLPSSAGGTGFIPGPGAKFPHASQPKTKNKKHILKQKQYCNKFNKDFKDGLHQKEEKSTHNDCWRRYEEKVTFAHC